MNIPAVFILLCSPLCPERRTLRERHHRHHPVSIVLTSSSLVGLHVPPPCSLSRGDDLTTPRATCLWRIMDPRAAGSFSCLHRFDAVLRAQEREILARYAIGILRVVGLHRTLVLFSMSERLAPVADSSLRRAAAKHRLLRITPTCRLRMFQIGERRDLAGSLVILVIPLGQSRGFYSMSRVVCPMFSDVHRCSAAL